MANCTKCGTELETRMKFCFECGTAVKAQQPKAEPVVYSPETDAPFGVTVTGDYLTDLEDTGKSKSEVKDYFKALRDSVNISRNYKDVCAKINKKKLDCVKVIVASGMNHFGLSEPTIIYSGDLQTDMKANGLDFDDLKEYLTRMFAFVLGGSSHWEKAPSSYPITAETVEQISILLALVLKYAELNGIG